MRIEICDRRSDAVIFAHGCDGNDMLATVEAAVRADAYLTGAGLAYTNLAYANLADAHLAEASLAHAGLAGADLTGAGLADANLAYANLAGANLAGAYLGGAYLDYANLARANLADAYLAGANLAGANLADANLAGANLAGANLAGANLADGARVLPGRSVLQIGPIGSRSDWLVAYRTDQGLRLDAGGMLQITREAFERRLADTHEAGSRHDVEYRAALAMIDEVWK